MPVQKSPYHFATFLLQDTVIIPWVAFGAAVALWRYPLVLMLLLSIMLAYLLRQETPTGRQFALSMGLLGFGAELIATHTGLWSYQQPPLWLVPVWAFPLWSIAALFCRSVWLHLEKSSR